MVWTAKDSEAYWREVQEEQGREWARAAWAVDPLDWRFRQVTRTPWDGGGPHEAVRRPQRFSKATWRRALSLLPDWDQEVLRVAMARWGGRSGDGHRCAADLGLQQGHWVQCLDRAEAKLAWVARYATPEGGAWDRERVALSTPWPDMTRAYLRTWTSLGACKICGVAQSTLYARLLKPELVGPIISHIFNRPGVLPKPERLGKREIFRS